MTSSINPNNIDGAYPVAGQDNDSQGFRDNFTNTKTNFAYAKSEIEDLQKNAVLKGALNGTTLNNNMNGVVLSNAQLQDMCETMVSLGSASGTITLNYSAGSYYSVTTSGSISLAFNNLPPVGTVGSIKLELTVTDTAYTLTVPSSVGNGTSNTSTDNVIGWNSNVISFASTGTYVFEFSTHDAGSSIFINDVTRTSFYSGSEDLGSGSVASLSKSVSYFSTSGSETATLADGVDGQIKTFIMTERVNNMVITVANAGWKASGSGTITFAAVGRSCILQFINSKWYCIGNNGATFA